jgi:hypothetical protein
MQKGEWELAMIEKRSVIEALEYVLRIELDRHKRRELKENLAEVRLELKQLIKKRKG